MKNLENLKSQYEALGEEIKKLETETAFKPGWYMYWDNGSTNRHLEYLSKPYALCIWDNIVPLTIELVRGMLAQAKKTKYNWDNAPDWAMWAVRGRNHYWCESNPVVTGNWILYMPARFCGIPKEDVFDTESEREASIEERPK